MRAVRARVSVMVGVLAGVLLGAVPPAALAAPGDLDATFDGDGRVTTDVAGGTDLGTGIAVQADGKTVAVGRCVVAGSNDFCVVRYNADGSLDTTFGSAGKVTTSFTAGTDQPARVAIQPDGRIVVAGSCQVGLLGNTWDACVARYSSSGALDGSFGSGGKVITDMGSDETGGGVAIHAGKILVGVTCTGVGEADPCFARYNADGTLDTTFDEVGHDGMFRIDFGTTCWLNAMAVASDGRFYGAMQCTTSASTSDFYVARFSSAGTFEDVDTPFITASTDVPFAAAVQADGKLVVGGSCTASAVGSEICLLRYGLAADLTLDPTFSGDGIVLTNVTDYRDIAVGVHLETDGQIVAAGRCEVAQNLWDFCALRYGADGSLDTSFAGDGIALTDFGTTDQAISSALGPDGRLVLIGQCGSPPVDFCLARYQSDDAEAPVVTIIIDPAATKAGSGWYNAATSGTAGVTVRVLATDQTAVTSITCSDGTSSVLSVTGSSGSFTLGDGRHSIVCEASDGVNAGAGPGSTSQPVEIDIDQTAPTVACYDPALLLNAAPGSLAIADLDDATSGTLLTEWFESAPDTATPGTHPVLVSVDDNAGNVANVTCGYQVVYGFAGFDAPVSSGSFDYANAVVGRLIPFRFTLTDAFGQPVTSIPSSVGVATATGSCTGSSTTLVAADYRKGKGGLSNLGNGVYEFRWKGATKLDRGQCRLVTITLADGVGHEATIQFAP